MLRLPNERKAEGNSVTSIDMPWIVNDQGKLNPTVLKHSICLLGCYSKVQKINNRLQGKLSDNALDIVI